MRIVLRFSPATRIESLIIGDDDPHRVELALDGGALFGPRTGGGVIARPPEPFGPNQQRVAFTCGEDQFDMFMQFALEQTGKPFDWFWLPACRMKGKLSRDWRSPNSWAGPEMMQWLSEIAGIPLIAEPPKNLVTTKELFQSPRLSVVGRYACTDKWERWKVWGTTM